MLSFAEVKNTVEVISTSATVFVEGPMGIGKSSIARAIWEEKKDSHDLVIFDCAARSEGDVGLPWLFNRVLPDGREVQTTGIAPSDFFKLHTGRPLVVCFDELTKASKLLFRQLLPIILERNVAGFPIPDGSYLMATGNLLSERVGDYMEAHAADRMCVVQMRKPRVVDDAGRPTEWVSDVAVPCGLPVSAIGFVMEFPQMFAEYSEEVDNPYIHNPKRGNVGQFVTPRSLTLAAKAVVANKHKFLSPDVFHSALAGFIGDAAAREWIVYIDMEEALPTWAEVVAGSIPESRLKFSSLSWMMFVYRLAQHVTASTLDSVTRVLKHAPGESKALFVHQLASTSGKAGVVAELYKYPILSDVVAIRTAK